MHAEKNGDSTLDVVILNGVFGFFSSLTVFLEETVQSLGQVFLTFATQHFARFALAFSFRKSLVVFLKQVKVILKY